MGTANTTLCFIYFIISVKVAFMMWSTVTWRRCRRPLLCWLLFGFRLHGTGRIHHTTVNSVRWVQDVRVSFIKKHWAFLTCMTELWVSVDDRRWTTPSEEDGCRYSLVRRRTNWAFISNDAHKITWILIKPFRNVFRCIHLVKFSSRRCSHLFLCFTSQHANALGQ